MALTLLPLLVETQVWALRLSDSHGNVHCDGCMSGDRSFESNVQLVCNYNRVCAAFNHIELGYTLPHCRTDPDTVSEHLDFRS